MEHKALKIMAALAALIMLSWLVVWLTSKKS